MQSWLYSVSDCAQSENVHSFKLYTVSDCTQSQIVHSLGSAKHFGCRITFLFEGYRCFEYCLKLHRCHQFDCHE